MATPVLNPVSEYLRTSYRPDCDYIDGEVLERNLGETPHSGLQLFLGSLFLFNEAEWGLRAFTGQRIQVSPSRFRVPDVCVIKITGPPGPILLTPPVLCVEILSPGDTLATLQMRIDDYVAFGVETIWLIDPVDQLAWIVNAAGVDSIPASGILGIPDTAVKIPLVDLYARLDRLKRGV